MTVSRAIPLSMAAVLAAALLLALLFRGPPPDPAAALPAPTAERSSRDAGPTPLVEATSRDTIEAGQAARAPSLVEAAAAEQLDFVVVDPANAPVAGAEVGRLTTEGFLEALGSTDGAGRLRVTLRDEDGYVRVLVRHPAHAQTVRSVGHQRTGEVRVRLADLSAITGRVVDAGGTSVAGARVAALPSRHHSYVSEPSACAELLRKGAWPGALATSDTHGRFTLEGLALGEPHLVFAALGSAISQMVGTRAGTGEDAILVLEEVLGIELRAVTGEGEPVPAASLSRSDGFWAGPAGEGVRILDRWKALGLGLTDLDLGPLLDRTEPSFVVLGVRTDSGSEPRIPRIQWHVQWPGFHEARGEAELARWGPGFPTELAPLRPMEGGTGRLLVALEPGIPSNTRGEVAVLSLTPAGGGDARTYSLEGSSLPWSLTVPSGTYRVACTVGPCRVECPRSDAGGPEILVTEGQETRVAFSRPAMGAIRFEIADASGVHHDGKLPLLLRELRRDRLESASFLEPPYLWTLVPEGDYTVEHVVQFPGRAFRQEPRSARVMADGETTLKIVLE